MDLSSQAEPNRWNDGDANSPSACGICSVEIRLRCGRAVRPDRPVSGHRAHRTSEELPSRPSALDTHRIFYSSYSIDPGQIARARNGVEAISVGAPWPGSKSLLQLH